MDVEDALARLKEFRRSWANGDLNFDDSRLTVADLDAVIQFMDEATAGPA